jgi:succinoglycan biosynthesis protein ExoU
MRRAFLDAGNIRYDEKLRLGEDYDLYLRALANGARYKVIEHCGYGAVVRHDSLSSRHRTEDLRMLYEADERILKDIPLPAEARAIITAHRDHIRDRYEHRAFLDTKARSGFIGALGRLLSRPQHILPVSKGIFFDKLDAARGKSSQGQVPSAPVRYLLAGVPAGQK